MTTLKKERISGNAKLESAVQKTFNKSVSHALSNFKNRKKNSKHRITKTIIKI